MKPLAFVIAAALAAAPVMAQAPVPAAAEPQQQPAPAPETVPAGFELIEAGDVQAITPPANAAWVREALQQLPAVQRPSTMPGDLADRAAASTDSIVQRLATRLALEDAPAIRQEIQETLIPRLRQAGSADLKFRFLVATRPQLLDALAAGWEHPRFRYNRILNDFAYDSNFSFDLENPGQRVLVPVLIEPEADVAQHRQRLAEVAGSVRETSLRTLSNQTQLGVLNFFTRLIADEGFSGLELGRDQSWFGVGVSGVLGAEAASAVTGLSYEQLLVPLTLEPQNAPIKAAQINLLSVPDLQQANPQVIQFYLAAYRRKAIAVTANVLNRAPEGTLREVMQQLRTDPPADGAALVRLLEQKSGLSLTTPPATAPAGQ